MSEEEGAPAGFECSVCEKQTRSRRKLDEWWTHSFHHETGELTILTCPDCAMIGGTRILGAYLQRIKDGRNLNYH